MHAEPDLSIRSLLTDVSLCAAAALEELHIPPGVKRVLFKTLNTQRQAPLPYSVSTLRAAVDPPISADVVAAAAGA